MSRSLSTPSQTPPPGHALQQLPCHNPMVHLAQATTAPTCYQVSEQCGVEMGRHSPDSPAALLRNDSSVDAPVTNSLCCAAAGIIDSVSATAEALIPHEKLRGAATPDATLIARKRPPAQPVVGYTHVSDAVDYPPEAKVGQRYWPNDLTNVHPQEWAAMSPKHVAEFAGKTEVWLLLEAAQKRIAKLEQLSTNLREELEPDARSYRYLRTRDLETINLGGVFAGMTPVNIVLNGIDLDAAIDAAACASAYGLCDSGWEPVTILVAA